MKKDFLLGEEKLSYQSLYDLSYIRNLDLGYSDSVKNNLQKYRTYIEQSISSQERVYGVNTGFGFLSNVAIEEKDLSDLQMNLIRSHACGLGKSLSLENIRALIILRLHTFCMGHSAVSLALVDHIRACLKADLLPFVPEQGSVGASGDLAPLAHLALGFVGEGKVFLAGKLCSAAEAYEQLSLKPYQPSAKEGLSLINGTHFMAAIASFNLQQAYYLKKTADIAGAMSTNAIRGSDHAFLASVQDCKPHPGQQASAKFIRSLFEQDDEIRKSHEFCGKVQDPYSFRCMPQVHGASQDVFDFVSRTVNIELNSVTDNPLVMENGAVISGGNFHGQAIAFGMDFLAMATAELASISERRIEKMTSPQFSDLPSFLIEQGGLNSGYMIPHVVAAALVSENKTLCHPASIDSIPTSASKEDHVSMGAWGAVKARTVLENTAKVLAIELLAACQGFDLLKPLKAGKKMQIVYNHIRSFLPICKRINLCMKILRN